MNKIRLHLRIRSVGNILNLGVNKTPCYVASYKKERLAMSRKIPEVLDVDEQDRLLEVFNERYPTQKRNKTMIKFMLDTGLRLSEIINLKWSRVDMTSGKVIVKEGKGAKDRIVYIDLRAIELLSEWRDTQLEEINKRDSSNANNFVFTTLKGNRLNSANIRQMVYTYSDKAGISKQISPHTFRHTFATDLLRETNNIRIVQKALGHADISTTQIYTHIVDEELENGFKSLNEGRNKRRMS